MRAGLVAVTLLGLVALALRAFEIDAVGFRWDQHAYGSVVWTFLGLQTFHVASSVAENLALLVVLFRGRVGHSHRADVAASAVLWYLVVAGAVLQYALVFVDILRTGVG
jgi:heme/copper-type cytochrome/quinol oxidase subunit 3